MKRVLSILPIILCLLCTSCVDVLEEIFINKDGSGRFSTTIDMSKLMQPEFQSMMESFGALGGEDEAPNFNLSDLDGVEMDSLIAFADAPEEILSQMSKEEQELLSNAFMRMEISGSSKVMKTTIEIEFDEVSDIEKIFNAMSKVDSGGEQGLGNLSALTAPAIFTIKKKTLTRIKPADKGMDSEQEEAMGMMAMFFADANYTTKYYFPKEVKSSTIANGIIEGNLLTVKNNLIDIMTNKADISGEIKFK